MTFTHPSFLLALAGLSVPIAIHLLSRKEGKVIQLGSLRHVQETATKQFKAIRLNEILLLLLRCTMIIVLCLLLAGLSFRSTTSPKWVVIEKELIQNKSLSAVMDSLTEGGYEPHLLATDFPLLKDTAGASPFTNYRKANEELTGKQLSDVIVFASNRVVQFNGLRETLSSNVRWINQPLPEHEFALGAWRLPSDSVVVRFGRSNESETDFTTKLVKNAPADIITNNIESVDIFLLSDDAYTQDKKVLKAILAAIEESFPVRFSIREISSIESISNQAWILALVKNKPVTGAQLIYLSPQPSDEFFLKDNLQQWAITKRLTQETVLRENVAIKLASLLLPKNKMVQTRAMENDRRMIPNELAWDTYEGSDVTSAGWIFHSADKYLILVFLFLLLVERMVAYQRNQ